MPISKTEMKTIEKELERMEIEILKLKAKLVPTVKLSKKEKKELERAKKDIAKGNWISGRELIEKLS